MFIVGACFLAAAMATAAFFGPGASLSEALTQFLPSLAYGMPGWVGRLGVAGAWQQFIQPLLGMPCWVPFLALGAMVTLVGVLRRV